MSTADRLVRLVTPLVGDVLPVRIRAWDDTESGPASAPVITLVSRRALRRLIWQPNELGLAQAYVTGEIDVPGGADDLAAGLRAAWRSVNKGHDRPQIRAIDKLRMAALALRFGAIGPRLPDPDSQAGLAGEVHTPERDRSVIAHHYDLSNEFYALILDPSMAYSCAYYTDEHATLAQAQEAKLDLVCDRLELRKGMRLLDVGCGWGSLILHAAQKYGVSALGVTLSAAQHELVTQRIAERGLTGQVEVRLQDYRTLDEAPADAVASLEMGEHVGEANYGLYADTLFGQLRPGGRLLLQQMSRAADAAPGGGPFIESYIAPDMHMRPVDATLGHLETAGFEILQVQSLREHYVRTVAAWLDELERHQGEIVAMVGEEVARVWRLYLVGGGLSFEQGRMGVEQILATKPSEAGSRAAAEHFGPTR